MDIKVNKEEIPSAQVIFDDVQEQPIELDYALPDYYPEIFRILKCIASPSVLSFSINGERLTYELCVSIRVLYCSENSSAVQSISQKLNYTKNVELGRSVTDPRVCFTPKTDYINCRAVNQRRLDLRGAVSVKIKVTDSVTREIVCDAFGGGIQLKKTAVTYPANKLSASKRVNITEEFDLGLSKPPISSILRSDAVVASVDKKVIANKLIAKGEVYINMLYSCTKDDADTAEAMQFTLPFSQIVDMDGIDERYCCSVRAEVTACDIEPRSDGDGNSKVAECSLDIFIDCSAYRAANAELAVDEYSTAYKTQSEKADIKIELPPEPINTSAVVKGSLQCGEGGIDRIYDVWCTVGGVTARPDTENGQLSISGNADYTVMARNSDGETTVLEKEEPFTISIPAEELTDTSSAVVRLVPVSCSYNLASDSSVEAKAELRVTGDIENSMMISGITDIAVNEDEPVSRGGDYALRLYFTDGNEDMWEIAKKYGTSVSAIMEENETEDETVPAGGMLLIPIV